MIHKITFLLLAIGGLNWLLFAVSGWEIGNVFGGMDHIVSKVIYILVGLSAVYELIMHGKNCGMCGKGAAPKAPSM